MPRLEEQMLGTIELDNGFGICILVIDILFGPTIFYFIRKNWLVL